MYICVCVPAGCHSVFGCYSGRSWLCSRSGRKQSRGYRRSLIWGQQTPDLQIEMVKVKQLGKKCSSCINGQVYVLPTGVLGLNTGRVRSVRTEGDSERDRLASGPVCSILRLLKTGKEKETWHRLSPENHFICNCRWRCNKNSKMLAVEQPFQCLKGDVGCVCECVVLSAPSVSSLSILFSTSSSLCFSLCISECCSCISCPTGAALLPTWLPAASAWLSFTSSLSSAKLSFFSLADFLTEGEK